MSKYYATITGYEGQDEAPSVDHEGNRPVAVVNPSTSASTHEESTSSAPSPALKSSSPPRSSPTQASANPSPKKNVKQRRKQQRLNGILDRLVKEKQVGSDQSPSTSSSTSNSSPEPMMDSQPVAKPEPVHSSPASKKSEDLQVNKNFGIKLGDKGSGQIKILGKITEVTVKNNSAPAAVKTEPKREKPASPRSNSPPQLDYLSDRSRSPSPEASKPEKIPQKALKRTASESLESQGKSAAQKATSKQGLLGRGIPIGNLGNVVASVSVPNRRLSNGSQPSKAVRQTVAGSTPKRASRPAPIKTPSPLKVPQSSSKPTASTPSPVPTSSPNQTTTTSQSNFKPINMAGRTIFAPNMVKSLVSPKSAQNGRPPIPSPTNLKQVRPNTVNVAPRPMQKAGPSGNNIQRPASTTKSNPSARPSSRPNIRPPPPPPTVATRAPAPVLVPQQQRAFQQAPRPIVSQVSTYLGPRIVSRPVGRPPLYQNSHGMKGNPRPRNAQQPQPALDPNLVDIVRVRPNKKSGHHKYPPPTLVEGGSTKWGANIKTIKMADGVTCGIKVQSQSLYQKVNITNSKLREVKRAIADEFVQDTKKKKVPQEARQIKPMMADMSSGNLVPVKVERPKTSPPHSSKGMSSGASTLAPKATTPIKGNLLSRFPTVGTAKLKTSGTTPQKHCNQQQKQDTKTEKVEDGCSHCCGAPKSAPSKPIVDLPPSGQNLVLSPENQVLVRKYLDKHPGQKMDFALAPVQKNMVIDPSFPVVKVGQNEFQLIPKEIMLKQQKAQRQLLPKSKGLAQLQPKPGKSGTSDSNGSQNGSEEEEGSTESRNSSDGGEKRIEKKNLFVWKEAEITNEEVDGNMSKKIFLRTFAEDDHECCHQKSCGRPKQQQVFVRQNCQSNSVRVQPRIQTEQVHYADHHNHGQPLARASQFVIPPANDKDNEIVLEQVQQQHRAHPKVQNRQPDVIYYGDEQPPQPPINTAPDGNYEGGQLITTGGYRVETLEEIKAKVSQEFTQDQADDSDDDRLVIDQLAEDHTKSETSTKYRFPSGPYIETDSEATPTKPKHIPVDTSDDESMPELEDASEEMPALEPLPELDDVEEPNLPMRKRKSLPAGSGSISPVKRQRRGIRRSQSTTEADQDKPKVANRLTSLIEKTREICENPASKPKSPKKRKVLTKRSPKKRQRSSSSSSSEEEDIKTETASGSCRPAQIPPKMHAKPKHQRVLSDTEAPRHSAAFRPEPCENESRIDSDRSGTSSDGIPDLSIDAMRKRRRILGQLEDTPEFANARLSGTGRSRRSTTGRPARSAARTATEKTKQNLNDEKGRLKPIVVEKTVKAEKKQAKSEFVEPKPKSEPTTPTSRRRRPSKKQSRKSDPIVENLGWEPIGDRETRHILKPGENTYVERVSFDAVRDTYTDRVIRKHDSVVIFAGQDEPPMYAIIVDLYLNSGQIMAWIYWYYKREDADAPSSQYISGEQELIASRHHDSISVTSILRSFHVLTFIDYCRWRGQAAYENAEFYSSTDENESNCRAWRPTKDFDYIKPQDEVFYVKRFYDHSTRSIVITPSFIKEKSESSSDRGSRPRSTRRLRRTNNTETLRPSS